MVHLPDLAEVPLLPVHRPSAQFLLVTKKGVVFLDINELFRVFGFIFMILIGFELMEMVEMYFKK